MGGRFFGEALINVFDETSQPLIKVSRAMLRHFATDRRIKQERVRVINILFTKLFNRFPKILHRPSVVFAPVCKLQYFE